MNITESQVRRMLRSSPSKREELRLIAGSYPAFRARYWDDPAGFVRDCIRWNEGEHPSQYQYEILDAIAQHKRYSVRGPHGLGKTALAAWVILWFALTRDGETDWKIPCTASVWRQLSKFLMPEVHKWAMRLKWEKIGRPSFNERHELHDLSLRLSTGEAFALASGDPSSIEGAHASSILYVFDEAKAIMDETWDAAEGALSVGDARALAISTPGEPVGRFYEIQSRKPGYLDWTVRHITKDEAVKAGRISLEWTEARKLQWGENSAVYQNRVEGNFAASSDDGVIPLSYVEQAIERWNVRNEENAFKVLTGIGVDIGRGGDKTVIAREYDDNIIRLLERTNDRDLMPVTGRVRGILYKEVECRAVIDVVGIGAGVFDNLRDENRISGRVIPFVASASSDYKDKSGELGFTNLRSAAWWHMRELLEDNLYDLPDDEDLIGDLTSPRWSLQSNGRIQVEPKEKIRERIGRSTDSGDAVIQVSMKKFLRGDDSFAGRGKVEGFKSKWGE